MNVDDSNNDKMEQCYQNNINPGMFITMKPQNDEENQSKHPHTLIS